MKTLRFGISAASETRWAGSATPSEVPTDEGGGASHLCRGEAPHILGLVDAADRLPRGLDVPVGARENAVGAPKAAKGRRAGRVAAAYGGATGA
jgi:hypothetical protein